MKVQASKIFSLLNEGLSYNKIASRLNCSKSIVAYYAKKFRAIPNDSNQAVPKLIDWTEVQAYYDDNHTVLETVNHFQFSKTVWDKAVKNNDVKPRHLKLTLDQLATSGPKSRRRQIKRLLLELNIWEQKCSICGQGPEWNHKKLTLQVDHINGDPCDHRIENLRLLCPNCHSQTETHGSKRGLSYSRIANGKQPSSEVGDSGSNPDSGSNSNPSSRAN